MSNVNTLVVRDNFTSIFNSLHNKSHHLFHIHSAVYYECSDIFFCVLHTQYILGSHFETFIFPAE